MRRSTSLGRPLQHDVMAAAVYVEQLHVGQLKSIVDVVTYLRTGQHFEQRDKTVVLVLPDSGQGILIISRSSDVRNPELTVFALEGARRVRNTPVPSDALGSGAFGELRHRGQDLPSHDVGLVPLGLRIATGDECFEWVDFQAGDVGVTGQGCDFFGRECGHGVTDLVGFGERLNANFFHL